MTNLDPEYHSRPAAPMLPLMRGPVARLAAAALAGVVLAPMLALALVGPAPDAVALALAGYLAAAGLAVAVMRRGFPHADPGLCNHVTLLRLVLAAALLAPLAAPAVSPWAILGVAVLALSLDGVDGWLARREGRSSPFGARFDMEVDAALGLILALNAWAAGTVGAVVLLLGLPRYVFVAAARIWPWLAQPLPERFGRKTVCVVQIAALIALQVPGLGGTAATAIVAATATALAWSFGRDVMWLWRARP